MSDNTHLAYSIATCFVPEMNDCLSVSLCTHLVLSVRWG